MKKLLKPISIVLIIANLLLIPFSAYAATGTNSTTGDNVLLSKWKGYGLLDKSITNSDLSEPIQKIDFIRYINDLLKSSKQVNIGFSDVPKDSWYGAELAKAVAAGYVINQDKANYSPFTNITRLDASIMIAHVFELELQDKNLLTKITDAEKLDSEQLATFGAVVEKGYLSEISSGRYAPFGVLKLTDALQMLDKCIGQLVTKANTITSDVAGNMLINTGSVTLKNITVNGDLIIGEGVANGDVNLQTVKIKGRLIIRGGGPNSVNLINTQIIGNLIVEKSAGDVHVELSGTSKIEQTYLKSGGSLTEKKLTSGKGFVNVTADRAVVNNQTANLQGDFNDIMVVGSNINVKLNGNAENIKISKDSEGGFSVNGNVKTITTNASKNTLELLGGTISALNIETGAKGNKLTINGATATVINIKENTAVNFEKGTVEKLTIENAAEGSNLKLKDGAILKNFYVNAGTTVTGQGRIYNAYVYSNNVSMGIKPSGSYLTNGSATNIDGSLVNSNLPSITIHGVDKTIQVGKTEKVVAYVTPTDSTLLYSSSDKAIATVNDKGMLTANSVGSTTVHISALKDGYAPNVATIKVTATSDNITATGTLAIDPSSAEVGKTRDFTITYTAGDDMLNGTVFIRLHVGFIALESDTVIIDNSDEKALGAAWQSPDTLSFGSLNLSKGDTIVVKLKNKVVPAGGQYEISAISDADGTGPKLATSGEEKAIFTSNNLIMLATPTNYTMDIGSTSGTTKLTNLSFDGLAGYTGNYKWLFKLQSGELTSPKYNDVLLSTEYSEYTDQSIPVVVGQHLILAAVDPTDGTNKIRAYVDITITAAMIRPADAGELVLGTNYNTPASGTQVGTVSVDNLNYAGAHHFMIKVQDTPLTAVFLNTPFTGAQDYISGDDIKINADQHIILAAVNSNDNILAYCDITVNSDMVSKPAGLLLSGNNFAAPAYGSAEGTTMIEWMAKGNGVGSFPDIDHWMVVVLDKAAVIPAKNASATKYQIYTKDANGTERPLSIYAEKSDITVTLGQHLLLVGVNVANQIQAYADIKIDANAVRQANAPLIPIGNFAVPVKGSVADTTMIPTLNFSTAIPGAKKYMVKVQDVELTEAPQLNSSISDAVNCVEKQNITITAEQHLILIATDDAGKIKAYQDILVTDGQIRPKDALKLTIAEKDYLSPEPGTVDGSTKIVLYSTGIPRDKVNDTRMFGKWMYMVQSSQFTAPYDGSAIPSGMKDYPQGTDITKEYISAGQHILIVAVDTDNKIMAYTEEIVTPKQIKQAKASELILTDNYTAPVAGLLKDTTRIMYLDFKGIYGATQWLYEISSSPVPAPDYDSVKYGLLAYSEGTNVKIVKGQFIVLYAVDNLTNRKVKALKNIQVTEDNQIKTEVPTLNIDTKYTNYVAPTQGSAPGTTRISTLSFAGIVGLDPLRWEYAVGDKAFIAPAINTTLAASGFTTKEYVLNTDIDNINPGQFILLLAVDGNNVIQGYANIPVLQGQIKPADAGVISISNYSLVQGVTEGTTRFDTLNRVGISGEATKWMIKTQKDSFNTDTSPIGKNTKVEGVTDYSDTLLEEISIAAGEHILLLATDQWGNVKAYVDITVAKDQIKNPFAMDLVLIKNYTDPQPGTSPGAISITLKTTDVPTDDTIVWKYKIGGTTAFAKPHLDDDASGSEYHVYESNENIQFVANNNIMVVAVNLSNSKIKAYKQFKITEFQIKPAEAAKLLEGVGNNYIAPIPGSEPGTTKIGGLSPIGLSEFFHHWVVKVVGVNETINLNSIILYPTNTNYTGGNISVGENEYVLLAAVDINNRVKAYANVKIAKEQMNSPLAPDIAAMNYSSPKYGTAKGTTSIKVSPDEVTYVLKVANTGENISAGQTIAVTVPSDPSITDYGTFRKYVSNTDIKANVGQFIILVAIDSGNKAIAFKIIPIYNAVNPGYATELTSPKNYSALQPGAGSGTTMINDLDFVGIDVGELSTAKWVVKVDNSAPAIPLMNSSVNYVDEYTANEEIKVIQGQVVQLYALNASGYVKGYAFIPVGQGAVKGVAPRLYPVPVPGVNLNTTILTSSMLESLLKSVPGATEWQYAVLGSAPADILKDSKLTYVSGYTGTEILAAEGKHLVLVATDSDDFVKAYADIILTDKMLKGINAAISGTIIDSTGESDIVAGGRTIIITLDSSEWQDDVLTDSNKLKLLFNGFTPTVTDTQWKNVVAGFNIVHMNPVDKKVITIRLSECIYNITKNQQINLKIDKSLIKNAVNDVIVNAFTIGADVEIKPLTGTGIIPGLTKDDIVTGLKTIIVELSVGEFDTDVDTDADKRKAIFNGITTTNSDKTVRNVIVATLEAAGSNAIKWNSKTKITITLPAISGFNLDNNEVFSLAIPCKTPGKEEILVGAVKDAVAPTQIIISADTSVSLSGTLLSAPVSEADIVAGGKTLIITLTKGQWVTDIATDETKRNALFTGLSVSPVISTTETAQWTKVISALSAATLAAGQTTIIRSDDGTTVTITLPAVSLASKYDISKNQTIALTIPKSSIIGGKAITAGQTITIERLATAKLTGTTASITKYTETEIGAGGKTIVVTLTDATFVDTVGTDGTIKKALFDGLKADVDAGSQWFNVIGKLKDGEGKVVKTSASVVTITLPVSDYDITADQTISVTVPTCAAIGTAFDIQGTSTLTILNVVAPVTAAKITDVNAASDKSYKTGETVDIFVTFDKDVTVTGKPYFNLETGINDTAATYSSGSGTKILTFRYTVQAGDISQKLDYKPGSLMLPTGATIVNKGSTTAVNKALPTPGNAGSLLASNIYIDGVVPKFVTGYPKAPIKMTASEIRIPVKVDEAGKIRYIVVQYNAGNIAPSPDEIIELTTTLPLVSSGILDIAPNTEYPIVITGLDENTHYTVYMVADDIVSEHSSGNTTSVTAVNVDITPPEFGLIPVQGTLSDNKIDIVMQTNEDGDIYMIALPVGSTAPISAQVKEFKNSSNTPVATALTASLKDIKSNTAITLTIKGLQVSSNYDIYVVCVDKSGNLIDNPAPVKGAKTLPLNLNNVSVDLTKASITNITAQMEYSVNGGVYSKWNTTTSKLTFDDTTDMLVINIREIANTTNTRELVVGRAAQSDIDISKIDYDIAGKKIANDSDTNLQYRINDGTWYALNARTSAINVDFVPGPLDVRIALSALEFASFEKNANSIAGYAKAPNLVGDDVDNIIIGLNSDYEYSFDGVSWTPVTTKVYFAGTKNVMVRVKATKEKLPSAAQIVNFTACVIKVVAAPAVNQALYNSTITITFEENTNQVPITIDNFKGWFKVGKGWDDINKVFTDAHEWGDILQPQWTAANVLTIKYTYMTGTTVAIIGDEVRIDPLAKIKNAVGSSDDYTSTGKLTGSFHTVPVIDSIKAVKGIGNTIGFKNGDKIIITFDQATNKPNIDASNIDDFLILKDLTGKVLKYWNTDPGNLTNLSIAWNSNGTALTITFNDVSKTELTVQDKVTVSTIWNLKDVDGTTKSSNASLFISGSFTSTPEITNIKITDGKDINGNSSLGSINVGDTITITFDKATNKPQITSYILNEDFGLTSSDGKTVHSWGVQSSAGITWNSDGTKLTIKLSSIVGVTLVPHDKLTLSISAGIKAEDNGTAACADSNVDIGGSY